jgi:pyruvate/2-oxoglutarate dehydrogenase complex dihydrolipoamide dehydrogenase (E3) component
VVYTAPELAWVGRTEEQCKAEGVGAFDGDKGKEIDGDVVFCEFHGDGEACEASADDDDAFFSHGVS